MKIEDQVCTFEQSKRLKELGIQQKGVLSHEINYHTRKNVGVVFSDRKSTLSAWTVAELGRMIDWNATIFIYSENTGYSFFTNDEDGDMSGHNEAQLRTQMLIYQLENDIISAKDANKKLI